MKKNYNSRKKKACEFIPQTNIEEYTNLKKTFCQILDANAFTPDTFSIKEAMAELASNPTITIMHMGSIRN